MDSREAKGTTTLLFSYEEGVRKVLSSEEERRDVDLDKFSQLLRGSAVPVMIW